MKSGKIKWFDRDKGEGELIDIKTNTTFYFHYTAIPKNKTVEKNQTVKFSLYENLYMSQVDKIKL